ILFILIFLTVLIALNTTLSGVTNTQVKLSADIMVESFLKLEKEQVKLAKEVGQIDLSIQTYILGGDKGEGAEAILTHTEQAKISLNEIESIADELSEKAMNRLLHDAYIPYMEDMGGFLQQAAMMAEHIQKGDAAAADESYNALETFSVAVAESEAHFQTVLNERIAHENSLIHSRITRSTVIVWSMAAIFIITVAVTFWLSLKTIITPLKNAHTNLSNIIAKLENNEGDLTVRLESKSEDEVGQLITGINRFLETLQNVIIAIKTSSNEINKSTKNISVQIGQSQDATSNISASLNELSAGMEEVSSMIQNIDAGAQEVLSEANVLADHAESNSNQVVEIVERADEILVQSNQSKLEMETVVEEIKQAMDTAIK
ncbi:HAMP domain-containing protein, partial [Bacillus cereus]|uniref:HAMP domain-containing protein n=1 Tax=Bacillus cereus TaxID=1396 RepID=UPI00366FC5D4